MPPWMALTLLSSGTGRACLLMLKLLRQLRRSGMNTPAYQHAPMRRMLAGTCRSDACSVGIRLKSR
jgi:hypothetical protein